MYAPLQNDSFLRACLRQPTEHTPVWLMRQAGRYLPEYRATRAKAGSFMGLATNTDYATEVTLQPLERYALDAHAVGHHEDQLVALHRRDHRQAHAGVARGRLDDRAAGFQRAGNFGRFDHRHGDAVFDRAARVGALALDVDAVAVAEQAVDAHVRRVADGGENVLSEHGGPPWWERRLSAPAWGKRRSSHPTAFATMPACTHRSKTTAFCALVCANRPSTPPSG